MYRVGLFYLAQSQCLTPDKAPASRAEGPGFQSRSRPNFSGSSHTDDFKRGTPVATLPSAWRYRISVGTGWPGASIL